MDLGNLSGLSRVCLGGTCSCSQEHRHDQLLQPGEHLLGLLCMHVHQGVLQQRAAVQGAAGLCSTQQP